jgi:neutral ceramidase
MRSAHPAAALTACLALAACHSAPGATGPDQRLPGPLTAGAAQRPLDEPVGISTAGYTQDPYLSGPFPADEPGSPFSDIFPATRGVETAPMVKVVAFDNGRGRLVLARLDAVFVTAVLTERVLQVVREAGLGDLSGKLILDATHTHAAGARFSRESILASALLTEPPLAQHALAHGADTFSQEVTDRLAKSIAAAIGDALANLRPARLGVAAGEDKASAHDRRCENDWITGGSDQQTRLTAVRVEGLDGAPIAALFHYAMHGTISGSDNRMLSIDAPGHAELEVERTFDKPVVAMYLQGAAGDASPSGAGHSGAQAMQHVGKSLAAGVATLWAQAGAAMESEVVLQSLERQVPISHDGLGYAPGEFHDDGAILCQAFYTPDCPGAPIEGKKVICLGPGLMNGGKYTSRVAAARIGKLALVTLPGEPVAAVGRTLRDAVLAEGAAKGITDALVLGYAQDHDGYLLLDSDWLSGGYEPTITFWGWRYARYIVAQSADAFHELLSGSALLKQPEPKPVDPKPLAYTAAAPTDSLPAPSVAVQPPAQAARLASVRAAFFAGDPALGTPEVRLQRQGSAGEFEGVLVNGWIPVSSLRGELPLFYSAAPTYKAAPDAAARAHRWEVSYEAPTDLPLGTYRLQLTGRARVQGQVQPLALATQPFAVGPAALLFDGKLASSAGKLVIDLTPRYPARAPVYAPAPNGDWQLDGYRLVDTRYVSPFAPADPGAAAVAATLTGPAGSAALSLTPVARPWPAGERFGPGEGPGLHAEQDAAPGHYQVQVAAGAFTDAWGNASAAASFAGDVQ